MDTTATAIVDPPSGFDESGDSSEQYKALMHVDKLHDYLRANAMKTLTPKEHK